MSDMDKLADDMIGTEQEWDALADAVTITAAERDLRLAVEAKEQALAGFPDVQKALERDDSVLREYDETRADMNEAVAEAAANLVDAWAAQGEAAQVEGA